LRYAAAFLFYLLAGSAVAVCASDRPVYVYLFITVDDHLNIQISEDRVRRTLASLEKLRTECSECGVSALFQLSGATSQQFQERNKAAPLGKGLSNWDTLATTSRLHGRVHCPTFAERLHWRTGGRHVAKRPSGF